MILTTKTRQGKTLILDTAHFSRIEFSDGGTSKWYPASSAQPITLTIEESAPLLEGLTKLSKPMRRKASDPVSID